MKRFILILIFVLVLCINARAEESSDENYGYISPEIISLDGNKASQSSLMQEPAVMLGASELPEKFDAREKEIIRFSGVGQYTDGTCWTFASTLCTETALGGTVDLSEQHVKYASSYLGNNPYGYLRLPTDGGNFLMYTAYASNWRGPVMENDDIYSYGYTERDYQTVTSQKPVSYHLQGTIDIPNPASSPSSLSSAAKQAHIDEVKYYVYKYGCLFSSMYWTSSYYNEETSAYYNSKTSSQPNHAINIIGWDDNYPKENFLIQPEKDGAFLIKNSQGYTGGYFYLSYEDLYAGWDAGAVTLVEDKYNYGELYTHEQFQPGASISSTNKKAKTTNVFTSRYDGEYVSAVGIVTKARNLSYRVYLSTTANGNDYDESKYSLCAAGFLDMPGFHTIKLDKAFPLGNKGTQYCVKVVFESDADFPVPLEYKTGSIQDTYAQAGQSFLTVGEGSTSDMGKLYNANLYVKAYTDGNYEIDFETESVLFSINGDAVKPGEDTTAGLNDEITLSLPSPTSKYYINGTEYAPCTDVTLKITENLLIEETNRYTYKFIDENGNILKEETAYGGTVITPPDISEKLKFCSSYYWDGFTEGMILTSDITFNAVYEYKSFVIHADEKTIPVTYKSSYTITPVKKNGYNFEGYFTEPNGEGTAVTDKYGNSLEPYTTIGNLTVYPHFTSVYLNKLVTEATENSMPGDTIILKAIFATDKTAQSLTVTVKYPEFLSFASVSGVDFEEVYVGTEKLYNGYKNLEITCTYNRNGGNIPPNIGLVPFELIFDVSTAAPVGRIDIDAESATLKGNEPCSIKDITGQTIEIIPKTAERIEITGEAAIDKITRFAATVYPDYTTDKSIVWTVDKDDVATVSEDGTVTPLKNGSIILTATAGDGSGVFATKAVDITAYATIDSLDFGDGSCIAEFSPQKKDYTVYIKNNADSITFTPLFSGVTLSTADASLLTSGQAKIFPIENNEITTITLKASAPGLTESTYTFRIIRFEGSQTEVSPDGRKFDVNPINIRSGKSVFLALYNRKLLVDVKHSVYTGDTLHFTTDRSYTNAKVLILEDLSTLKPVCNPETIE